MSPHVNVRPTAAWRSISWRAAAVLTALLSALATLGCAQTPPSLDAAAADANARVAPVHYRAVLGSYPGARPVEPAPWTGAPKTEHPQ
jgi:hypothetical protein